LRLGLVFRLLVFGMIRLLVVTIEAFVVLFLVFLLFGLLLIRFLFIVFLCLVFVFFFWRVLRSLRFRVVFDLIVSFRLFFLGLFDLLFTQLLIFNVPYLTRRVRSSLLVVVLNESLSVVEVVFLIFWFQVQLVQLLNLNKEGLLVAN